MTPEQLSALGGITEPPPASEDLEPLTELCINYPLHKVAANGWFIGLVPMISNIRMIVVKQPCSVDYGYDDAWCYADLHAAVAALAYWDPTETPEPEFWIKHPFTKRWREGGDPAKERVQQ